MVTGLSKPLDHNEPFEFESDNDTAEAKIDFQLSMQEKPARTTLHRQGNEFQNNLQITTNEKCNEYCENRMSYFRSRRQTWS
jgi:hypothetical protein